MALFRRSILLTLMLVGSYAASADDVTVQVSNDGPDTLRVSIWDLSVSPRVKILDGESISGFASIAIQIKTDGSGQGRVAWMASNTDPDMHRCGQRTRVKLHAGSTIKVSANDACAAQ